MFYLIIIIVTVMLLLLCFSAFEFQLRIIIKNGTNYSFFILKFFGGLIRLKFKIKPKTVLEDIIQNSIKGNKSATSYSRYIKKAITKTKLKRLSIILEFGLGDAAQTALLYGTIITISVPLKEYLNRKFGLRYYKLNLTPNFNEKKVNLDLDCIIYIKLGHIIIIGIRILVHKIKGGEINGRTSYRKYNDNHYGKYKGND